MGREVHLGACWVHEVETLGAGRASGNKAGAQESEGRWRQEFQPGPRPAWEGEGSALGSHRLLRGDGGGGQNSLKETKKEVPQVKGS